jgi:hypothetical protein
MSASVLKRKPSMGRPPPAAYVFSAATGTLATTLISPKSQPGAVFGARIAMDDTKGIRIAVGAWGEFSEEGRVHIFH